MSSEQYHPTLTMMSSATLITVRNFLIKVLL